MEGEGGRMKKELNKTFKQIRYWVLVIAILIVMAFYFVILIPSVSADDEADINLTLINYNGTLTATFQNIKQTLSCLSDFNTTTIAQIEIGKENASVIQNKVELQQLISNKLDEGLSNFSKFFIPSQQQYVDLNSTIVQLKTDWEQCIRQADPNFVGGAVNVRDQRIKDLQSSLSITYWLLGIFAFLLLLTIFLAWRFRRRV